MGTKENILTNQIINESVDEEDNHDFDGPRIDNDDEQS